MGDPERPLHTYNPNAEAKPILKHEHGGQGEHHATPVTWDEMNLMANEKEKASGAYGTMKIDEPPTPYNYAEMEDEDYSEEEGDGKKKEKKNKKGIDVPDFDLGGGGGGGGKAQFAVEELREKMEQSSSDGDKKNKKAMWNDWSDGDSDKDLDNKTHEEEFKKKRAAHYNEFHAIKLARELMKKEEDSEEDSDED
eukprot:Nk52_evm1s2257 gene=Nk52_evmTU1s2257